MYAVYTVTSITEGVKQTYTNVLESTGVFYLGVIYVRPYNGLTLYFETHFTSQALVLKHESNTR